MSRARGLAPWRPQRKTLALLGQIDDVLEEYATHLPLTIRQLFYRLVAAFGYAKTEAGYERLAETLNRARRAGLIEFAAIRDDGTTQLSAPSFSGVAGFWEAVEQAAGDYRLDRLTGQTCALELWVEAAGMAPQLARAVDEYGIAVYSSGGFDSLTSKHGAATRIARRQRQTVVLHVGDHDPSGVALFEAAAEDVGALVRGLGGLREPVFVRQAVLPEQIAEYHLETAPAKASDRRGAWQGGGTVQAEAFAPDVLASIVREGVARFADRDVLECVFADERRDREQIGEHLGGLLS